MGRKTSPIWKMDKKLFRELVESHETYVGILKKFGYSGKGGSGITLRQRIKKEGIDCSHIQKNNSGRKFLNRKKIPLEEVMIKNSTYSRGHLKKRLLKNGMLKNECSNCGMSSFWDNKKLVMILDHINGVNNDHRRENLRLLCPNCNSQTSTFSGKIRKKKYNCERCGQKRSKGSNSKLCKKCSGRVHSKRKIENRPSKEQLLKEIKETNYCAVGRKYGVSDNAIRKWLK